MTEEEMRLQQQQQRELALHADDEDEEEEEMPEMEVYSYEREEIYDPTAEYDVEPIRAVYEDEVNRNDNALQLRGSCHTIEEIGESDEEIEYRRPTIEENDENVEEDNANQSDEEMQDEGA